MVPDPVAVRTVSPESVVRRIGCQLGCQIRGARRVHRRRQLHGLRGLLGGTAEAKAPCHDELLDLGCAAGVGVDGLALFVFQVAVERRPFGIVGERMRSHDAQDRARHPRAHALAIECCLGALVGVGRAGTAVPVVAHVIQSPHLGVDVAVH